MTEILWGLIGGAAMIVGTLLLIIILVGWWPVVLLVFSVGFFAMFVAARQNDRAIQQERRR